MVDVRTMAWAVGSLVAYAVFNNIFSSNGATPPNPPGTFYNVNVNNVHCVLWVAEGNRFTQDSGSLVCNFEPDQ